MKYFKEMECLNIVLLPNGSLTYSNVLSKNRPPYLQTRSRVNKHGGENKDLKLTGTIFYEEHRFSICL
jgi:hypothetical protein